MSYRTVFARRAHHLRIPMLEELTEAVLIHAAANGSRPSAAVSSVAAVLSRASYRFLNPPHKVGGLRALTAGPFSVPRRCGRTRDSGVLPGGRARLKESLKITPSTPTELFHVPPRGTARRVGVYERPMGRSAYRDGHALVPVTGQLSPLRRSMLPLFTTPP